MIGILKSSGYKVRPAASGVLALAAARKARPDLILLDINMPEMNGYEVCEALKADPELESIPVIFLSALNEMDDKVRAFHVGGVDYITKPFHFEEVNARVESQLKLLQYRTKLHQQNAELAQCNALLREAQQMRDNFLRMLVHDMRAPLTIQLGYAELLLKKAQPPLAEKERAWSSVIYETSAKLAGMVNSLLDISRIEAGKMPVNPTPNNLCSIVEKTLQFYSPILRGRRAVLESANPAVIAHCDGTLVQRIVENLVGNAIKFTAETGSVRICITEEASEIRVAVTDDGLGILPGDQDSIFMMFGQASGQKRKNSTGIGLAFCRLAVQTLGGRIGLESTPGDGSTFWFTLPVRPEESS